jgi:hypothetical protein
MSNGAVTRALFFVVAADMDVGTIGPAVGKAVDQPRIPMKGEDDGLVRGEERQSLGTSNRAGVQTVTAPSSDPPH